MSEQQCVINFKITESNSALALEVALEFLEQIKIRETNKELFNTTPKNQRRTTTGGTRGTARARLITREKLKALESKTNGKLVKLTLEQEEEKIQYFKTVEKIKPIAIVSPLFMNKT